MPEYQHIRTYGATDHKWLTAIADMELVQIDEQYFIFTTTELHGGGIASHKLDPLTQTLTQVDSEAFPKGATFQGSPEITFFDRYADKRIYLTNLGISNHLALDVTNNGMLNGFSSIASPTEFKNITAFGDFETTSGRYIYSAFQHDLSFHIAEIQTDGQLTAHSSTKIPLPYPSQYADIQRLMAVPHAEKQYILAFSALGDFVASFELSGAGTATIGTLYSGKTGAGFRAPTDGVSVEMQGRMFIIVAGSSSSSLTVMELSDAGILTSVDHTVDEKTTRYSKITAIDAATVEGRSFIFVAGVDKGFSVFTLQPNGILLHVKTIEDTLDTTLGRVSDIETLVINGKIEVFITSTNETGISQFRFDPGIIGMTEIVTEETAAGEWNNDLLIAGPATARLMGQQGDDILIAGNSSVRLNGGPDADLFVPTSIKGTIIIEDYEPGIDRLDFSQLKNTLSVSSLQIKYNSAGAVIVSNDTTIRIITKNKVHFPEDEINNSLFPIAHFDGPEQEPVFLPPPTTEELLKPYLLGEIKDKNPDFVPAPLEDPLEQQSTETIVSQPAITRTDLCYDLSRLVHEGLNIATLDDDIKIGTTGDDTIDGGTKQDVIIGGAGQDVLRGGPDQDVFIFNSANDSPFRNSDTILDFKTQVDLIDLRMFDLIYIHNSEFSGKHELRWLRQGQETHILADLNDDGNPDFEITLTGRITLTADDFLL